MTRFAQRSLYTEILLVWLCLLSSSFLRTPIPSINEPHYLNKARHYVDPAFCAGDFFLESADVQTVFFQLLGPIAQHSLFAAAFVGRLTGYGLLAVGWVLFWRRLIPEAMSSLPALWLFLVTVSIGNFSGEWLVSGIESKVYSYGFLFLSLPFLLRENPGFAIGGALTGCAIMLHPVVGMWHLLALVFGDFFRRLKLRPAGVKTHGAARATIRFGLPCVVFALPGILPAMGVVLNSAADAKTRATGNYLQVFGRLKHHLDPLWIHAESWIMYALLLILFVWLWQRELPDRDENTPQESAGTARFMFYRYVAASLLFAAVGVLVGVGARPASKMIAWQFRTLLLKFYPFRLFDLMLPIACIAGLFALRPILRERFSSRVRAATLIAIAAAYVGTLVWPHYDRHPDRLTASQRTDWHEVCVWVGKNLPADALVMTPSRNFAFKWYAERAEFVSYKDCPQDALGIVEWNRRLWLMKNWASDNYADKIYSSEELQQLRAEGITHLLAKRLGPMKDIEPLFKNGTFRVFEIPQSP